MRGLQPNAGDSATLLEEVVHHHGDVAGYRRSQNQMQDLFLRRGIFCKGDLLPAESGRSRRLIGPTSLLARRARRLHRSTDLRHS
jgi:hypothetical protein